MLPMSFCCYVFVCGSILERIEMWKNAENVHQLENGYCHNEFFIKPKAIFNVYVIIYHDYVAISTQTYTDRLSHNAIHNI